MMSSSSGAGYRRVVQRSSDLPPVTEGGVQTDEDKGGCAPAARRHRQKLSMREDQIETQFKDRRRPRTIDTSSQRQAEVRWTSTNTKQLEARKKSAAGQPRKLYSRRGQAAQGATRSNTHHQPPPSIRPACPIRARIRRSPARPACWHGGGNGAFFSRYVWKDGIRN